MEVKALPGLARGIVSIHIRARNSPLFEKETSLENATLIF